jgi:DNA-binding NarL/FixJ family response regulator
MPHRLSSVPASLTAAWPLVGRDVELGTIARARADAACAGVVVSAGAGIGKSRLAREAYAEAEREGALVGWVQATSSAAAVPLGAFAGLIPDDVRSDDALELMRRSTNALRTRANGRKIVLGLDDAQLLDPVSAALVLHLTVEGHAFVLATLRADAPCPDAILSLWKDGGARRLELGRLSDDAMGDLVEAALGGPVEQGALRWLVETSQGNVLYVRELVLGALESGSLTPSGGLWQMAARPPVSASLADLVARRMAGMAAGERAPVELLAVGEPLRLNEVASLTDYDGLVAAEARGVVVVDPAGDEVRLAHPLYGEAVRGALPVLRARGLRARVAGTLQLRDPFTPDDALRVARLLLDAGQEIPSGLLVDAARAANLAGDPRLGAQLAAAALEEGAGLPAALLLARAHTVRKRFAEAEATLAAVADLVGPDEHGIDYLEQRAHVLFWGLDRRSEARALLDAARAWSPEAGWRRRLEPLRVAYAAMVDGFAGSVDTLTDVLSDPGLDAETRRMAERRLALALFFTGRTAEARALAARLRPAVPLRGYSDALALGLWRLMGFETGADWPEFDAYMAQTLRDAVRANDHEAAGHGAFSLGYTRLLAGRYRDAGRWFAEAELHFEQEDTFGTLIHVRAMRVGVDYFTGDPTGAAASLERLHAALGGREPLSSQVPYVARAEGWAARMQSDAAGAQRLLRDAAALAPEMPGYAAQLAYEALRAGAPAAGVAGDLAALAERCDARLVAAYAAHAAALAARDATALAAVADEMAAIGALVYGVEAAVQAAEAFVRMGREDSARRAVARARELFVAGQGVEFPEVDGLDSVAVGLTRRESQVATLAGRGLSNAEIADQLVLSVRTVETHVYRAMQKRGVSDRREL